MRYGLSYSQASSNSNVEAHKAHDRALAEGKSKAEAQEAAAKAYDAEMRWYEGGSR